MIRPIAIYLPQFHPIPENDEAWGKDFTEWTNVEKAKPLFHGHYQPHIPHEDIGYYDLRDPEVLIKQAEIAKRYGIYGFAFYHYWFNGKQLLDTPLNNMLNLKEPNFPFLYIWANENWTKRWDGRDNEIIIKQEYSFDDDLEHIKYLCEHIFCDERYIKIEGKPVFAVYRTELFPDIKKTAEIWREQVKEYGFDDLYLIRVESFLKDINPLDIGFNAAMEFAPNFHVSEAKTITDDNLQIIDYTKIISYQHHNTKQSYPRYRMVFPIWDNTARKKNSTIFVNTSLSAFRFNLEESVDYTKQKLEKDRQFLFINAWNEWGEGCHIEPDAKYNYSFLETIHNVLENKPGKDQGQYINFLEEELKESIENTYIKQKELINTKNELIFLKEKYRSRGYVLMEKILKRYRIFKNYFRPVRK